MSLPHCEMQRGLMAVCDEMQIGSGIEEQLHRLEMPGLRGGMQSGGAIVVAAVNIRMVGDKQS